MATLSYTLGSFLDFSMLWVSFLSAIVTHKSFWVLPGGIATSEDLSELLNHQTGHEGVFTSVSALSGMIGYCFMIPQGRQAVVFTVPHTSLKYKAEFIF